MGSYGANRSGRGFLGKAKAERYKAHAEQQKRQERTVYLREFEFHGQDQNAFRDFPNFEFRVQKLGRRLKVELGAGVMGRTCQETYIDIHLDDLEEIVTWASSLNVESLRDLKSEFRKLLGANDDAVT